MGLHLHSAIGARPNGQGRQVAWLTICTHPQEQVTAARLERDQAAHSLQATQEELHAAKADTEVSQRAAVAARERCAELESRLEDLTAQLEALEQRHTATLSRVEVAEE
jgi:chromosome segregation ATPase